MTQVYVAIDCDEFGDVDQLADYLNSCAERGYRIATVVPPNVRHTTPALGPIIILEQLELFPLPHEASATAGADPT